MAMFVAESQSFERILVMPTLTERVHIRYTLYVCQSSPPNFQPLLTFVSSKTYSYRHPNQNHYHSALLKYSWLDKVKSDTHSQLNSQSTSTVRAYFLWPNAIWEGLDLSCNMPLFLSLSVTWPHPVSILNVFNSAINSSVSRGKKASQWLPVVVRLDQRDACFG